MAIGDTLVGAVLGVVSVVYDKNQYPWVGEVHFDAALSEAHTISGTATEHPVEEGSDISDHFRSNPRVLRMEGFITNTPIREPLSQAQNVKFEDKEFTWEEPYTISKNDTPGGVIGIDVPSSGLLGAGVQGLATLLGANEHKGTARGFSKEFNRVGDAFDELIRIATNGTPVVVYTLLGALENVVLENLESTEIVGGRKGKVGVLNSITFTCDLKQIRTVKTETTKAPIPAPTVPRAEKKKNKGKQGGENLADGAKKQSLASSLVDSISGIFQ